MEQQQEGADGDQWRTQEIARLDQRLETVAKPLGNEPDQVGACAYTGQEEVPRDQGPPLGLKLHDSPSSGPAGQTGK